MEIKQGIVEKLANISVAIGVSLFTIITFCFAFKVLLGENTPLPTFNHPIPEFKYLIFLCIFPPIFEELIFRHIPAQILKKTEIFQQNKWWFVLVSGVIFGWLHGSYYNIFCQGVAGIAFGWVYIKNGYSYYSAVASHSLYNFLVGFIIPMLII